MTDRDEALHYLLNKLKSEDGWSSANLTWNDEKLAVISDQFSSFDGVVKAKVLLSFLSMSPRTISQVSWKFFSSHFQVKHTVPAWVHEQLRARYAIFKSHTHVCDSACVLYSCVLYTCVLRGPIMTS